MKLTVVGCSPAWANGGGTYSGYLVESRGRRVLLDCGPGVLARLRASGGWPQVDAIVISHFHLDHCGDLVPWLWGHLMGPAKGARGPALVVPPGGLRRVTAFAPAEQFAQVFTVSEYAEAEPFEAGGVTITPRRVLHYDEPTWGLRVEADASVLAYSADTAPTPSVVELARGADVFLCEATLVAAEDRPRGHMTADEARAACRDAGAQRLLLTHRPSEHPVDELVHDGLVTDV